VPYAVTEKQRKERGGTHRKKKDTQRSRARRAYVERPKGGNSRGSLLLKIVCRQPEGGGGNYKASLGCRGKACVGKKKKKKNRKEKKKVCLARAPHQKRAEGLKEGETPVLQRRIEGR